MLRSVAPWVIPLEGRRGERTRQCPSAAGSLVGLGAGGSRPTGDERHRVGISWFRRTRPRRSASGSGFSVELRQTMRKTSFDPRAGTMAALSWRQPSCRLEPNTIAYCSLVLSRQVARHPPPPPARHGGGVFRSPKFVGPRFLRVLRRRCDRRGFERLTIEIIAKRRVTPAFEAQKGYETGAPRLGPQVARARFCFAVQEFNGRNLTIITHPNVSNGGERAYRVARAGNGRNRPETGHSALRAIASSAPRRKPLARASAASPLRTQRSSRTRGELGG
jgi:hypothetical protein